MHEVLIIRATTEKVEGKDTWLGKVVVVGAGAVVETTQEYTSEKAAIEAAKDEFGRRLKDVLRSQ